MLFVKFMVKLNWLHIKLFCSVRYSSTLNKEVCPLKAARHITVFLIVLLLIGCIAIAGASGGVHFRHLLRRRSSNLKRSLYFR